MGTTHSKWFSLKRGVVTSPLEDKWQKWTNYRLCVRVRVQNRLRSQFLHSSMGRWFLQPLPGFWSVWRDLVAHAHLKQNFALFVLLHSSVYACWVPCHFVDTSVWPPWASSLVKVVMNCKIHPYVGICLSWISQGIWVPKKDLIQTQSEPFPVPADVWASAQPEMLIAFCPAQSKRSPTLRFFPSQSMKALC